MVYYAVQNDQEKDNLYEERDKTSKTVRNLDKMAQNGNESL